MKKGIWSITAVMVLLLLTACGQKDKTSVHSTVIPTVTQESTDVPGVTQTIPPTLGVEPTATIVPSQDPTLEPTATIMPSQDPTLEPTATIVPSQNPTSEPTATTVPSQNPTSEPTATTVPSQDPTSEPTATIAPTQEPTPEPTVTLRPVPTPAMNPNSLITNGWQKMISIDGKYKIIFPELYKESVITKTDRELEISYSCKENKDISLTIGYAMQQTRETFIDEILSVGGIVAEEYPAKKKTACVWQLENKKYFAIFVDEEYSRELLGPVFGDEEQVPGVMYAAFSYPADQCDIYETEQYNFYIISDGEE